MDQYKASYLQFPTEFKTSMVLGVDNDMYFNSRKCYITTQMLLKTIKKIVSYAVTLQDSLNAANS